MLAIKVKVLALTGTNTYTTTLEIFHLWMKPSGGWMEASRDGDGMRLPVKQAQQTRTRSIESWLDFLHRPVAAVVVAITMFPCFEDLVVRYSLVSVIYSSRGH